jgi:GntR family transcriptional regulator, galactonate operon transcriptional repressor
MAAPLQRLNLCGQLVHNLGNQILGGNLKPGDSIPHEETLRADFGVSRTVIREAIRSLVAKGLLESRTKRGTTVRPKEFWNFLDSDVLNWCIQTDLDGSILFYLTELRQAIEPMAASIAAERGSDKALAKVAAAAEKIAETADNVDAFTEADIAFHTEIIKAADNPLFGPMNNVISSLIRASLDVTNRLPEENRASVPFHKAVADAICSRDPEQAKEAMLALFGDVNTRLKKLK